MLSYSIVNSISKTTKNILGILLVFLTAIFIAKTFTSYYGQLQQTVSSLSLFKVGTSFLLFVGYLYMRALSWRFLIMSLEGSISKVHALTVWFLSEVTRFIPGNVWAYASRVYLSKQRNLSNDAALLAVPVEIAVVTLTTTLLSLIAIQKNMSSLPLNLTFLLLVFGMLIGLIVLYFFQNVIRRFVSKIISQKLNPVPLLGAFILQAGAWFLYSVAIIVLVNQLALKDTLLFLSSSLLAWLVGYLSFVTPMGLGVREGAFIVLTGQQIGVPQAAFIALLSRVILISAELVNLVFWVIVKRIRTTLIL